MSQIFIKRIPQTNDYNINPKVYDNPEFNIKKVLGKSNIKFNKCWTHHGGGGWYTWYTITNLDGAKKCAEENGYEIIIEGGK